jgi:hypothetical protein
MRLTNAVWLWSLTQTIGQSALRNSVSYMWVRSAYASRVIIVSCDTFNVLHMTLIGIKRLSCTQVIRCTVVMSHRASEPISEPNTNPNFPNETSVWPTTSTECSFLTLGYKIGRVSLGHGGIRDFLPDWHLTLKAIAFTGPMGIAV